MAANSIMITNTIPYYNLPSGFSQPRHNSKYTLYQAPQPPSNQDYPDHHPLWTQQQAQSLPLKQSEQYPLCQQNAAYQLQPSFPNDTRLVHSSISTNVSNTMKNSPCSSYVAPNPTGSYSSTSTTPLNSDNSMYPTRKQSFEFDYRSPSVVNNRNNTSSIGSFSPRAGRHSYSPLKITKRSKRTKSRKSRLVEQRQLPNNHYISANKNVDISQFTDEDVIILKNMLPLAEIHKWKYISNKLSKARSRKFNAEYCINKFHEMYGIPFNPKNSLLQSNYFMKLDNSQQQREINIEGMLGSSIPYVVCKDGWNAIDP